MRLSELMQPFAGTVFLGDPDTEVTGLSNDSRLVKPGDLFICVPGAKQDGHDYLEQAFSLGATAALVERDVQEAAGHTLARTPSVKDILAGVASRFHGYPSAKLNIIGVTGTNGKTTSTYLIRGILEEAGYAVGLIGTMQNLVRHRALPAVNTSPGPVELQSLLAMMVNEGCRYTVMEVSSHAIAQGRTRGCSFQAGLFTNITQDHLDYHHDFAEYLRVKRSFFAGLAPEAWAVINGDDPQAQSFLDATQARTLTYGIDMPSTIKAINARITNEGTDYTAVTPAGRLDLRLHLAGRFNIYNSLGALGIGLALGIDLRTIGKALASVSGVPGRFQVVPGGRDFRVVVDYAHTPDGLENVLKTARQLTKGRLIVVFGCGGDRDRGKRPLMGEVAARLADLVFVTSDNPRSEDPAAIIKQIEEGLRKGGKNPGEYRLITDRKHAIGEAIAAAVGNDFIVIAGKGHETDQKFADRTIHFDDREVAALALEERQRGVLTSAD